MKNIAFMMISMMSGSICAQNTTVEVFSTTSHSVALNGRDAQLCEMDVLEHLTQRVNQHTGFHLSFKKELDQHTQEITTFYDCQNKALSYELRYLPAIVLNHSFVVYGVYSVDRALSLLSQYKGGSHA